MPLAALEVVGVVCRGDLYATRAEVPLHHSVGHHDHLPLWEEGVHELLAHHGFVAVVLRVHGHSDIPEHRLETRGGNVEVVLGALDLVLELAQNAHLDLAVVAGDRQEGRPKDVLVVHLQVGEGRAHVRAPVHEAVVPVDEALVVETHEGLHNGLVQHGVHGEALSGPIWACGNTVHLVDDAVAVLVLPIPHALQELIAAEVVPRDVLLPVQQALHHALRCDAGVVCAWEPQRHVAAHAVPPGQGVLDAQHQSVADVQGASDIGRRDDHHELLAVGGALRGLGVGREEALLLPPGAPRRLHCLRDVGGLHR
mmetsp:Transcript_100323/g.281117  ORF Transcript_100323/g.281117 Transcript_100323/m.281117 type:complete len:311 (+) Transcript_100323:2082-3014(+)